MTIKEIASEANVTEKTLRGWIVKASVKLPKLSGKTTEARRTGVAADFTLEETIAIVRAGGNETLADLLAMNAASSVRGLQVSNQRNRAKLPSGAQLKEIRLMAEKGFITKVHVIQALGFGVGNEGHIPITRQIEEKSVSGEEAERQLRPVINRFSQKAQETGVRAALSVQRKEEAKRLQDRLNGKLPFEGSAS